MLLTENESVLENESIFFDAANNTILFKKGEVVIALTELQSRLIFLLLTGVTKKRDIIKLVWKDNHISITDNNYHQLIYQCRALFNRHGIPSNVLKTIPRHGAKFNYAALDNDEHPTEALAEKTIKHSKALSLIKSKQTHWVLLLLVMGTFTIFEIMN